MQEEPKPSLSPLLQPAPPPYRRSNGSPPLKVSANHEWTKNVILTSHGRPPWYDEVGKPLSDAFVIGIAGGSSSGKTHVAQEIVRSLGSIPSVVILSQDSFYKEHTEEELALAFANKYDFDHPNAIDMKMFASCMADLKRCKQSNIPIYSFTHHQRLPEKQYLYGASVIIAEGIMALNDPELRSLYDLKIFVQCDSDLMLARRIRRDVQNRGRSVEGVIEQYLRFVKPAYDNFVGPSSRYADIIVPGSNNTVAIDLICTHIRKQMNERTRKLRARMACGTPLSHMDSSQMLVISETADPNIRVLEQTPQLKGILTILRDKDTDRQDFIFFVDRLSTFLSEKALEYLPFRPKEVLTPVGAVSHGKAVHMEHFCGVSILRSGGPLEKGLKRVVNDVLLGSLLVQSDAESGEPLLLHTMLPVSIRERHQAENTYVFLLDAQIGTGAAAFMAIRVLLDHGVQQDRIIFVCFLIARNGGISLVRKAFPSVRFVCAALDDDLEETWFDSRYEREGPEESTGRKAWVIQPGMGHIGDRYYL